MDNSSSLSSQLLDEILRLNPMQASFLHGVVSSLPPEEMAGLETYVRYCLDNGQSLEYLAQSYDLIVKDTLREQIYFMKHNRYRFSSYDEVAGSVYMNGDYMAKYMYGLAITSFLWPNHTAIKKYFLQTIPRDQAGRYLEIGPGHGFYMMTAMKHTRYESFEGVDISPTSVEMTREILSSPTFGSFSDWEVNERDFLASEFEHPFDAVVMGEVLEHVEQPKVFLERIRQISRPGAYIFVTTCINSPAFDHIALFRSVTELEDIIASSSLTIVGKLVLPYHNATLEDSVAKQLPVNVAYSLSHS